MTKPTLSIFTGTETLGVIYSEQSEILSKFVEQNVPLTGSTGRMSFNLWGKTRIIIVQGAHNGVGFSGFTQEEQIQDFIYTMEEWINEGVQNNANYTNSFNQTKKVDCVDWVWVRSNKDPSRILYTLMMKEAF